MQTEYGELLLNWLFRGDALTPPSTWYFGLDVSLTGDAYVEPGYTGYARASLARSTASWGSATGLGQMATLLDVVWPTVPGGYALGEVVRRVFIVDAPTSTGEHVFDFIELADAAPLDIGSAPTMTNGTLIMDAGD